MDHTDNKYNSENYNPRETANIFSIITFFYNYAIIKKARKNEVDENDIYRVLPELEAEPLGDKLENTWKKVKIRSKEPPSITKCLIKCFGLGYVFYSVIQLIIGTIFLWLNPLVTSKFVAYFQPGQEELTLKDLYSFALAIVGINLFTALYNINMEQLIVEHLIKIRTSICSLIYRKTLKLTPNAVAEVSVGRIVTLISKDVMAFETCLVLFYHAVIGLLQIVAVSYILYQRVGMAAFPAIGVIAVLLPLEVLVGKGIKKYRLKTALKTDARFKVLQETLSAIKIIKMYTWQNYFDKLIHKARMAETYKMRIVYGLKILIVILGGYSVSLAFYVLLASYIAKGHAIEAETIYYVQTCLDLIRTSVGSLIPFGIAQGSDLLATLNRLQKFLELDEVDKKSTQKTRSKNPSVYLDKVKVEVNGKVVLNSISLELNKGLLLVTGNVGCGKSALLRTILGEFPVVDGKLVVEGTMSYTTEDPWLFPSTIRQNILFGEPYDEKRYQEVLNVCALTYDINQLNKLDQTIVGDKGINLSKGQQARVALARAIYRDCDIYLLDDCLASLDNHVNKHIFNECIRGFLRDKLCILVTNNLNNIRTVGNQNILLLENGNTLTLEQQRRALDKRITYYIDEDDDKPRQRYSRVSQQSTKEDDIQLHELLETDQLLQSETENMQRRNFYYEDRKEGQVAWSVYGKYYEYMGGFLIFLYLIAIFVATQFSVSYSEKLISLWVNLESSITKMSTSNETDSLKFTEALTKRGNLFNMYTILLIVGFMLSFVRGCSIFYFCLNGAGKLHRALAKAMLNSYMYFFDNHFIGNILNRLSKDFYILDELLPFSVFTSSRWVFSMLGVFLLVASVNWVFLIPATFLLVKMYFVRKIYLKAGRSLRRLDGALRSPIIGYLNSTLEGLSVIRAAQQQQTLQTEFDKHQDLYTSTNFMNQTTTRFFLVIINIAGVFFLASIVFKLAIFPDDLMPGDVGMAISQAVMLTVSIQFAIREITELENLMTSAERVVEYADTKQEPKSGQTLTNWPTKGNIRYENVSLTYKLDNNTVLRNINMEIEARNKVGIVGRTGAGKSSIISALFRLYDFDGRILIDGVDIKNLSLDYLRSHIGIIPQDPIVFSGTVRSNIDPFRKHPDDVLWNVLDKVNLKPIVKELDDVVTSYTSGQKQLFCLARALIENHKIVVLDEATANLDPETDQLLEKTIQHCFRDYTVIIIAHRLRSVLNCDKVVVLDAGKIVEMGEPGSLLQNPKGFLFSMVKEENIVDL